MSYTTNLRQRPRRREVPRLGAGALVYLAAPKSEYGTPRYRQLAAVARRSLPNAQIFEARTAYRDNADWRARWPQVLTSIAALVFLATPDGWIGRGVWAELQEAHERVPVYQLTDLGQLVPYAKLVFSRPDPENWTQHVRVTTCPSSSNAA